CLTLIESINVNKRTLSSSIVSNRNRRQWLDAYREVIKAALKYNAAAIVLSHNHPSGYAEPSHADRLLTDHLKQALKLVDICLLDHLVVGGMDIVSFAERGWL
ncbi:MAG: JAB domain-containing protein, partial [Klebsiella michiganensis]|nr:JAB domain-containing protein [Klebsiella michiganensis]